MEPSKYDFTIYQGSAFRRTFIWKDDSSNPINITGYFVRFQAAKSTSSVAKVIDIDSDDGIIVDGSAGSMIINLSATDTASYNFNQAVYNLEIVPDNDEDEAVRLLQGVITLDKETAK